MLHLDDRFLRGSLPPLVTPFERDGVDLLTFSRLVEHAFAGGSDGVVVAGTTGEPTSLSRSERRDLVEAAVSVSAGRGPVIAGTGTANLVETVALCHDAAEAGADALLVVTPYYVKPSQSALAAWFRRVALETSLPVIAYHIPGRTGVGLDVTTVRDLAAEIPNFVGVKHAVADLHWLSECRQVTPPGFRILVGVEQLSYPMLCVGADGLVNALGNLIPELLADLVRSVRDGDHDRARRIHDGLLEANCAVFWDTNPVPLKYLMWRAGLLPNNEHRLPLLPASPGLAGRLDDLLTRTAFESIGGPT